MTQAVAYQLERTVEIHPGIVIRVPVAAWNARERVAWHWAARMLPSEWAERFRFLTKSAIPGPWRNRNAPYLRGIMDLAVKKGIERLTIKKAAQIGVSEALRVLMGFWAMDDPNPMGLALPNKDKGREIVENEIVPFFKEEFDRHPELRELRSARLHDIKKGQIKLANSFLLHLMWSGSPASMASNPMKRAISDEVDKFEAWSGNDADPISLIDKRMRTYSDRIHVLCSTPTTAGGMISESFEQSHYKLYFLVPCPHCGCRQRLIFGENGPYGVKWTDAVRELWKSDPKTAAALVLQPAQCWYECCQCHGAIDERAKRQVVRAGVWGTLGPDDLRAGGPIADAEQKPEFPRGSWVGVQTGSLICCWESWTMAHAAAEFLQARTLAQKFAFRTSTLGETWADQVAALNLEVLDERVAAATRDEAVVPRWAARLIAVVDTQTDHFWLVIRAWGPGLRSARVWHGRVESFEELEQWCLRTVWKNEDSRLPAARVDRIFIDSGGTRKFREETEQSDTPLPSRVMEVYRWYLQHQGMITCIKGDARPEPGKYMRKGGGEYVTDREKRPVPLWLLDVHHFQDQLADLMGQQLEEVDVTTGAVKLEAAWQLNRRMDPQYQQHMTNLHKVMISRKGKKTQHWQPKRDGLRVDYRACEGYQIAGAFLMGVHQLPELAIFLQAQESELQRRAHPPQPVDVPPAFTTPDGRAFVATRRE